MEQQKTKPEQEMLLADKVIYMHGMITDTTLPFVNDKRRVKDKESPELFKNQLQKFGYRFTLAIYPIEGHSLRIAFAMCSPNDNFNKKIGRNIAFNRLKSNEEKKPNTYVFEIPYYEKSIEVNNIRNNISKSSAVSNFLIQQAKSIYTELSINISLNCVIF